MIPYCWAHVAFHTARLFPQRNRLGISIILLILTAAVVFVPFWILLRPSSSNYCNYDLFILCAISCAMSLIAAGFTLCFLFRDPVPDSVREVFQYFGFVCASFNLVAIVFVQFSPRCAETTPELYLYLNITSIFGLALTGVTSILAFFWIREKIHPGTVLDLRHQTGTCYEAYNACPCVWHV
eukprot:m.75318 g.75318  ORF g.75318 m.75318 type:complete len:182 (-) comp8476_c0_seq1:554-1099(-)